MNMNNEKRRISQSSYELLVPEGGWGYIITLSMSLMFIVTICPLTTFGMVYGPFLAELGDETSGTTLANGIFNTVLSFTGLAANQLLQKYSFRKVGLLGAAFFFLGSFGSVFVRSLGQFIFSFSILGGFGLGLMMPASFTSFNTYFDKRKNLMMNLAQALIIAVMIAWPELTKFLLETYGFRGTVAITAAITLHCFVAMCVLQPVEWHMIKKEICNIELKNLPSTEENELKKNAVQKVDKTIIEGEPLLDGPIANGYHVNCRKSVISIGNFAISVNNLSRVGKDNEKEDLTVWQRISKSLDLPLFKDPVYLNITIGLSLSITSDMAFISLLPLLLTNAGLSTSELTLIMTIYFSADLVSRILMSVVTAFMDVRNRYIFLAGSLLSAVFRTVYVMDTSFIYIACVASVLGFLRCFIQTPLALVIAEEYTDRFTTAFSLYMVVCGVVSLIFGPLMGFVKRTTGSDVAVVHVLTAAYLGCGIPWTLEILGKKLFKKKN